MVVFVLIVDTIQTAQKTSHYLTLGRSIMVMRLINFYKLHKILFRIIIGILITVITVATFLILTTNNKPPILSSSSINSTINTTESKYTITGNVENFNNTQLFINNSQVKIYDNGSFNFTVDLKYGKNDIKITLIKNGIKTSHTYTINRHKEAVTTQKLPNQTTISTPEQQDVSFDTQHQPEEPALQTFVDKKPTIVSAQVKNSIDTEIKITLSSEKNILDFKCSIKCNVETNDNVISVELLEITNPLYSFTPIISVSPGATIDSAYIIGKVFLPSENPHKIVVTAADKSTKEYLINVRLKTLIETGSLGAYPWNESNCWMSGYWSMGGADGNGGDGRGYGCRQCASYVAWKIASVTGKYYSWGNAVNFTSSAIAAGYEEGAPQAGSIAVMDPATSGASEGHVAWVEAVNGNTITISQYNYNYGAGYGMYSMMNMSASAFDHYVHIK